MKRERDDGYESARSGREIADRAERIADEARTAFGAALGAPVELALVLGSGLAATALGLEGAVEVDLAEIPSAPRPSVEGHRAAWTVGSLGGRRVLVMAGRVHGYEGVPLPVATLPIRTAKRLGARGLIVTNAAGGIRDSFVPGTLVRIADHLNFLGDSPLVGSHDDRLGERFVDMSEAYDREWGDAVAHASASAGVELEHGNYAVCLGPQYETPAEIRHLREAGADVVGMSTVPEVIVARQEGLRVFGLSVVTNPAAGLGASQLSHEEVIEVGREARGRLATIVEIAVREIR